MTWISNVFCHKRRARGKPQSGQATILFVLTFLTLFIFFAFVVNLALIVHHKINLQETADLAAYAGAAWQARAMDAMAIENFRMRQDYKELVFHTWITFGRMPTNWKTVDNKYGTYVNNAASALSGYSPALCLQAYGFSTWDENTTFCYRLFMALNGVPDLPIVDQSDLTAIAIKAALDDLGDLAARLCARGEQENKAAMDTLTDIYLNENHGLLFRRAAHITAMQDEFNRANRESADILASPHSLGRVVASTIRANLGSDLMYGLTRPDCAECGATAAVPSGQPLLKLKEIRYRFMLARASFENNGPRGACRVHLKTRTYGGSATSDSEGHFPAAVPVMFTKDRDVMTYYAVRLRSRPKLLYLPESWAPVLTAYAAAKPFGGRIGPDITAPEINQSFEYQGYIDSVDGTPIAASNPLLGFPAFPNYAFYPGDDMGYGRAMRRTTLVDIISSRGADMRPEHGTNGGRADRYPGFFASGQTGIGNVIFDGNVTSPGDPRREILVALRGPNAFDAMMFSIFPTRHSGTSGVSNIDDQFPGGAYYSSQEGIHESGAGADLAPIVSHFSAPGRPLGTEIIYADDPANASFPFYDIHSQILAHDPPPFNRTDYRRLVSSWAPADEVASADAGIAKYSAAEGLFRPEPGWGRTGYSVKLISFSSIKTPTFFNNGSAHAAPATPANSNLSFDGPGRRDPNIPEGPPRRGQVLH